jgi:hypothetical protein
MLLRSTFYRHQRVQKEKDLKRKRTHEVDVHLDGLSRPTRARLSSPTRSNSSSSINSLYTSPTSIESRSSQSEIDVYDDEEELLPRDLTDELESAALEAEVGVYIIHASCV